MSRARRYDLALQHMEAMLRAEQPPEPRWDELERRLLARIARPAPPPPARAPLRQAFFFAAAAAAITLGVGWGGGAGAPAAARAPEERTLDLASAPRAAGEPAGALDLRALRPGDAIEAGDAEVSLLDEGSVHCTLSPGSRAVVRAAGVRGVGHVVALERGALSADVVPRDPSEGLVEALAVDVARTRVAVHGTRFRVVRLADRVEVDVEQGAVAIGPAGNAGATLGHLLVGPSRGSFSLDGGRVARLLPRAPRLAGAAPPVPASAASSVARLAPSPPVGSRLAALAPAPEPASSSPVAPPPLAAEPVVAAPGPAAPEPPRAPLLLSPERIRAALGACFATKRPVGSPSVQMSITSMLRIAVRADGSVASVRFDPPLKPELQACAQSVYAGRFADGPRDVAIRVMIEE